MKEETIKFETADLAEKAGFVFQYTGYIPLNIPTQSLLQKWLREVYNINVYVQVGFAGDLYQYVIKWYDIAYKEQYGHGSKTYEQELEKGLQEALKLKIYETEN